LNVADQQVHERRKNGVCRSFADAAAQHEIESDVHETRRNLAHVGAAQDKASSREDLDRKSLHFFAFSTRKKRRKRSNQVLNLRRLFKSARKYKRLAA